MLIKYIRVGMLTFLALFTSNVFNTAKAETTGAVSEKSSAVFNIGSLIENLSNDIYLLIFIIIGIIVAIFALIYFGGLLLAAFLVMPNTKIDGRLYCLRNKVVFEDYNGEVIKSQLVYAEEDALPPAEPERLGYAFKGWSESHTHVISDKEIIALYSPNVDTPYKLEHYKQKIDGSDYYLDDTEDLTGTTDTEAVAELIRHEGFAENDTHPQRVAKGNIDPDGSLVLKLFYDREIFTVVFKDYDGTVLKSEELRYEEDVLPPAEPKKLGYTFKGWSESDYTNAISDKEIIALYSPNADTPYKLEHYKQKIDGSDYYLDDTEDLTGTTDTEAVAELIRHEGFAENDTHPQRVAKGNIDPDGSLVLKLFYDKSILEINFGKKKQNRIVIAFGEGREDADFYIENDKLNYELIIEAFHDKSTSLFKQGWRALFKKELPVSIEISCTPPGVIESAGFVSTKMVLEDGSLFSSGGVKFKYHTSKKGRFKNSSLQVFQEEKEID